MVSPESDWELECQSFNHWTSGSSYSGPNVWHEQVNSIRGRVKISRHLLKKLGLIMISFTRGLFGFSNLSRWIIDPLHKELVAQCQHHCA